MGHFVVDIHTHIPQPSVITPRERGIHPWHAEEVIISEYDWDQLTNDAEAIGEIGLDFAKGVDRIKQQQLFEYQLNIAQQKNLPVIIHSVKAFESVVSTLKRYDLRAVIFHGFIGSLQQAQQALNLGYLISYGERTLRSPKSIEAMRATPMDRIFVESDESTTDIMQIYDELSHLKGCTIEQLLESTYMNYTKIFGSK